MCELTGKIIKIFDERRISDKLTVREFVVKTNDQYPQEVLLQLANKKCDLIIDKHEGDDVRCHVNIRGRASTNRDGEKKWYTSIEAWKLEDVE
jgi:single-strand DNA-binding protein